MSTTFLQKKNNAKSTLATVGGINNSVTALDVQSGDGAKFPSVPFNVTIYSDAGGPENGEIVKVTSKGSGDNWTIARAQESTTAQSWAQNTKIELLVTAKLLQDLDTAVNNLEKRVQIVVATDGSGDYNTDGTADNVEIQQAIDSLPSGGGIVLLKAGTYTINATINVLKNNVIIRGEGKVTKIFLANSSNVNMLYIGNGSTVANDCVVEDVFFDPNGANQTTLGSAICIYGSSGTKALRNIIRGCRFTRCQNDNVKLIYADKSIIAGNTFDESQNGAALGIFSSSQSNTVVENVFVHCTYGVYSNSHYNCITGNIFVDNTYGVCLNGVVNCNVSGNWFGSVSYYQTGVWLAGSSARHSISGNTFYQPYRAILCDANSGIIGNTINGNSIYLSNQESIYLQVGCNQNAIVGNTIRGSALTAVRLRGASKNIVSSNMFIDNGTGANNTYSDILLEDDSSTFSTYNTIIGNNCQAAAANKVAYHIRENAAGDDYNLVIGNICKDGVTAQISLQGANSVRGTNIPASG